MKQKYPKISDAVVETWKDPQTAHKRRTRHCVRWERNGIMYTSFFQAVTAAGITRARYDHIKPRGELKKKGKIEWRGEVFTIGPEWTKGCC